MILNGRIFGIAILAGAMATVAHGQAMIGYGHGVANAGTAGAALGGAGVGGLIGTLGNVLHESSGAAAESSTTTGTALAADPASVRSRELSRENPGTAYSFKTSSGVTITGMPPTWLGNGHARSTNSEIQVVRQAWSEPALRPSSGETAAAPITIASQTPTETSSARPPISISGSEHSARATPGAASPTEIQTGHVIVSAPTASEAAAVIPTASAAPPAMTDADSIGISIGDDIDSVVANLGTPIYVVHGLATRSYNSKYVFASGKDQKVVVLVWNRRVVSVAIVPA